MKHPLRNDVQGLRAIAVLLVYASHSGFTLLSGGFIGVDVFFVISGYVITLSLLNEYAGSTDIKITRFYARRFIRLIPALFFVLLISNLIAVLLLSPFEQLYNYPGLNSAIVWLSNFYFLNLDGGYFDISASEYLYIHTWSLGVEEQFYLAWPLLILFGLGYFAKSANTNRIEKVSALILWVGIISFLTSMALTAAGDNNRAFYMMPARAWQFAIGAYIAVNHFKKTLVDSHQGEASKTLRNIVASLGLTLIIGSAYLFSDDLAYPSWRALVPTIGTAMLIAFQWKNNSSTIVAKILSSASLVWLGALSYSFYLWHWPVLYFQSRVDQTISVVDSISAFLLVVLLSATTYYLVENPLRNRLNRVSRWRAIGLFSLLTLAMFGSAVASKSYTMQHIGDADQQQIIAKRNLMAAATVYAAGCDSWYKSAELMPCVITPNNQEFDQEMYLIGDSIATQWFSVIGEYYKNRNWRVTILTKSSCPMVDQPFFYKRIKSVYTVCDNWRSSVIKLISENKPAVVILGGSSSYPYNRQQWLAGSHSVVGELAKSSKQIVLLGESGGLGFDGPLCLARESWQNRFFPQKTSSACKSKWREPESLEWLRQVTQGYDNVEYLDFNDLICADNCYAQIGDLVTFRDSQHITSEYVEALSPKVLERLNTLVEIR